MSLTRSGTSAFTLFFRSEEVRFDKIPETLIDELETFIISKMRRQSFTEAAGGQVRSNSFIKTATIAIAATFIVNYLFFNRSDDSRPQQYDAFEYEGDLLDYEIFHGSDLVPEDVDISYYDGEAWDREWNYVEDKEDKDREWNYEGDEDREWDREEDEDKEREW